MARVLRWTRWLLCENSKFYRWQRGRLGEKSVSGESIAQRSQRPQRGFGVGGQNSIGGSVGVWARNQVQQKSIAQRSQRPQRGIWGGWPKFYRWHRGRLDGEIGCNRKASHRGHRGGIGVGGQNSIGDSLGAEREIKSKGKASH
jgi:hypothetical protein